MEDVSSESIATKKRRLRDPSSTVCPKCESVETSSFEMAYVQGTSTGTIVAGSYTPGFGGTFTQGKTKSQTALATRTRPPVKPSISFGELLAALVLSSILAGVTAAFIPGLSSVFRFILFFGISIGGVVLAYIYQNRVLKKKLEQYNKAMSAWQRSWICLRCGHIWQRTCPTMHARFSCASAARSTRPRPSNSARSPW